MSHSKAKPLAPSDTKNQTLRIADEFYIRRFDRIRQELEQIESVRREGISSKTLAHYTIQLQMFMDMNLGVKVGMLLKLKFTAPTHSHSALSS
jgi:hypothetical protein